MKLKLNLKLVILLAIIVLANNFVYATHNRAGELLYEFVSPLSYRVTVITYSKISDISANADRDSLILDWGDGTLETIVRVNGPIVGGTPNGELIGNDIKQNKYVSGVHSYDGALPFFIISLTDQNRIADIVNIAGGAGSVNVPIYFEDTLFYIPPELFEHNSSPVLLNPPIDYASINDTFYHNPNAYDPDGDSLHFQLVPSLQANGIEVPLYNFPDQFPPGPNNQLTIDENTGEIIWATPQQVGTYNIAILITEYREGRKIGTLLRDMEIFVAPTNDDPPQIVPLKDTCVVAGSTLQINVTATDPNGEQVRLSANGAPFEIDPSRASFNATVGNPAQGIFTWNTICTDIRPQFYQVVFKAEDEADGNGIVLSDLETWLINVVPPPPTNLTATITNNKDVYLEWSSAYPCINDPNFQYFSVWRKIGCDSLDFSICDLGLDNTDYEMIATNITTFNYLDTDVDRGNVYSYRILAHFGKNPTSPLGEVYNVVASSPSTEACIELPLDLPVITNVSVEQTDNTTGVMFVQWSKPVADTSLLDTLLDPPPYIFELYRSEGFTGANLQLITSFTAPSYAAMNDTFYYDSLLNTVDNPYSYQVRFYADNGNDTLGNTSIASSVYLTIASGDQQLNLTWEEDVPWLNTTYTIFRSNSFTGIYDSIANVSVQNYIDTGLINDSTYCYYIRSEGAYSNPHLINPIINLSQINCGVPIDTIKPCPPNFVVENDCEQYAGQPWTDENYQNRLTWSREACNDDAVSFNVYYAEDFTNFVLLATTTNTFYTHQLNNTVAGCYLINAVDENGNIGDFGDTVCIENCAFYNLPNTFTPNGDGANDLFTPFPGWRFVESIEMKIFNRWGNLVWQTENPNINWDGTDQESKKDLNDGVYLYSGFYFVRKSDGTLIKNPLPHDDKGGGFIHLIRTK
ncbi:MAG: gliding motility-associated C-terminal domain-containing protein [Chitinophagales bacterium]|nr:gliding motility-associated C-terminal domain-containing protein [Chitinophagales bacterium]